MQAVVRQRTRLINQFHHLLALTFPELALRTKDLAAGWVLELVHRYPIAHLPRRVAGFDGVGELLSVMAGEGEVPPVHAVLAPDQPSA